MYFFHFSNLVVVNLFSELIVFCWLSKAILRFQERMKKVKTVFDKYAVKKRKVKLVFECLIVKKNVIN